MAMAIAMLPQTYVVGMMRRPPTSHKASPDASTAGRIERTTIPES
jgi:hypothetical protein